MVTEKIIHNFLKNLGIKSSDTVLIHTSMRAIGEVEGGCDGLIDAFKLFLKDGLLVIPTHTWANVNAENPTFDVRSTIPCIGALPTVAAFRKDGVRSLHPTHSVAVFGKRANAFVKGEENALTPCPIGGVWSRLYDENAKILLLGVNLNSNTYMHAVDERYNVTKRYNKPVYLADPIELTVIDYNGNKTIRQFKKHGWNGSREFEVYTNAFEQAGILTYSRLGNAKVFVMNAKESTPIMADIFKKYEEQYENPPVMITPNGEL
jgi:aminoglycoside 3-N-acetyltransferase